MGVLNTGRVWWEQNTAAGTRKSQKEPTEKKDQEAAVLRDSESDPPYHHWGHQEKPFKKSIQFRQIMSYAWKS